MVKNPPANAGDIGDAGLIAVLGKSPAEEHGNPLQYSCLRIPWTEEPSRLWSIDSHACTPLGLNSFKSFFLSKMALY